MGNTERGPPQFHRPLFLNPAPHTPGDSSALLQVLHAFHGLRLILHGSAPPWSHLRGGTYEAAGFTLCCGLKGCSSSTDFGHLASMPVFRPTSEASYVAPWRLPRRDSHPLANDSFSGHAKT